ncbi:hypothetical protein HDK64DRAFT_134233 [Phyllosticta capitalensis]
MPLHGQRSEWALEQLGKASVACCLAPISLLKSFASNGCRLARLLVGHLQVLCLPHISTTTAATNDDHPGPLPIPCILSTTLPAHLFSLPRGPTRLESMPSILHDLSSLFPSSSLTNQQATTPRHDRPTDWLLAVWACSHSRHQRRLRNKTTNTLPVSSKNRGLGTR